MNDSELSDLAKRNGLTCVKTDMGPAIIDFENFDEAYEFAEENNLVLVEIELRPGSCYWKSWGRVFSDFDIYEIFAYRDYPEIYSNCSFEDYFELIKEAAEDEEKEGDDDDELWCLHNHTPYFEEILEMIQELDDDEIVFCGDFGPVVMKLHCMYYRYDGREHAIAAVADEERV